MEAWPVREICRRIVRPKTFQRIALSYGGPRITSVHCRDGTTGRDGKIGHGIGAPGTTARATECPSRQMRSGVRGQGAVSWMAYRGLPI